MDSTSTCNTKLLGKGTNRKYKKQAKSILFIKSNQIHSNEKLTAKELYLILLRQETATPTLPKYFESMFRDLTLQWKLMIIKLTIKYLLH